MSVTVDKTEESIEDAAYLAEMSEPLDTDVEQTPVKEAGETEAEDVQEEELQEPERVEVFAGYTEDEIKENFARLDKMQRSIDTTNGTFGSKFAEQQATIEALRASGAVQGTGAISQDVIDRLNDEFPELAEIFASGVNTESQPDIAEPTELVRDERMDAFLAGQAEKEQQHEIQMLTDKHSDWKETAMFSKGENGIVTWNDPSFGYFVSQLPQDEQNAILNSWDAGLVSEVIGNYKASISEQPKQNKKPRPSLEDAVRPTALHGSQKPSAIDEEDAAYREEMARL